MEHKKIELELKSDEAARCIGHLTSMIQKMQRIQDLHERVLKRMTIHGYIICCRDSGYIEKATAMQLEHMAETVFRNTGTFEGVIVEAEEED